MWAGQALVARQAREQAAAEDAAAAAAAAAPDGPRQQHPGRGTLGKAGPPPPASALPLSPPPPFSPPTHERRREPSLGRETSATEGPLLHLLLPLLGPGSGGSAADAAHLPHGSVPACAAKIAVGTLGVAVLAMPRLLATLGAVPALLAVLAIAALTLRSTAALAAAAMACGLPAHMLTTRTVLAEMAGQRAATMLHVATVFNGFGLLTGHLMAAADALAADDWAQLGAPDWISALLRRRAVLLPLLSAAALPLLLAERHMQHHGTARMLGLAAVLLWGGATLYLAGAVAVQGRAHALPPWPPRRLLRQPRPLAALQLAAALPVLLTAFSCQLAFFPVVRELQPPATARRMRHATGGALGVMLLLLLALAAGSVAAFGRRHIPPNALACFSVERVQRMLPGQPRLAAGLALAVRLAYVLSLLGTLPLQMRPLHASLTRLRFPRAVDRLRAHAADAAHWRSRALTAAVLAGACALAVGLPSIWVLLQLVGATAGIVIACILPGVLLLHLPAPRSRRSTGGLLLIAAGLLLSAAGLGGVALQLH